MPYLKKKVDRVEQEVKEKLITYLGAAFGLVAGLAWNDAIKAFIEVVFPLDRNSMTAKFIYAFLMTIILVIVTIVLQRIMRQKKEGE